MSDLPDEHEPLRLLASQSGLSPAVRSLLLTPPPVKPLDAQVAMRVRGAVLQTGAVLQAGAALKTSAATAGAVKAATLSSQPMALAKLSAVAATAAVVGAGVMTLISSYVQSPSGQFGGANDRSGVVVVSANPTSHASHDGVWSPAATSVLAPLDSSGARIVGSQATASPAVDRNQDAAGTTSHGREVDAVPANDAANTEAAVVSGVANSETRVSNALSPESTRRERDLDQATTVLSVDDLAAADEQLFHDSSRRAAARDGRVLVRPAFRRIAASSETNSQRSRFTRALPLQAMSSLEQETLLLEEARTKLGREPESALKLAIEHQSKFRRGQLLEQRRMIHLEALLRLGRDKEALELAKSIGSSLYQARAQALLSKYGI